MAGGYYRMHRGWMDNPVFPNERLTKREAWLWLIEHAAWKDTVQSVGAHKVKVRRGQYATTTRFLAQAWRWSKGNVDRFLARLRLETMISNHSQTGPAGGAACTVITLCNYDVYQTDAPERGAENGAKSGQSRGKEEEVESLLECINEKAELLKSNIAGLFLLHTKKNPKEITKELGDIVGKDADKYKFTFHWIPVDRWCKSDIDEMCKVMKDIDSKMKDDESWKLDLGKRQYEGKSTDLIIKLTENINHPKVDLKNPQKIVKVEIIGDQAAISLLDKNELLDIPKLKTK